MTDTPIRPDLREKPSNFGYQNDHWDSIDRYRIVHRDWRRSGRFLYVGPYGHCRREMHGPIVPGPYLTFIPESPAVSGLPGDTPEPIAAELRDGSRIEIQSYVWTLRFNTYCYPIFTLA